MIDGKTAPIPNADFYTMSVQSDPAVKAVDVWPTGFGLSNFFEYDALRATVHVIPGSTNISNVGLAAYVLNDAPLNMTTDATVGLGVWSAGICNVDNCQSMAFASQIADAKGRSITAGVGRKLVGAEIDFEVTSPNTTVTAVALLGSSLTQASNAQGFIVGSLSSYDRTKSQWDRGFGCEDGVLKDGAPCFDVSAHKLGGTNIPSDLMRFAFYDGAGTRQGWFMGVNNGGAMSLTSSGPGAFLSLGASLNLSPPAIGVNMASPNIFLHYGDSAGTDQTYQFDVGADGRLGLNSTGSANQFHLTTSVAITQGLEVGTLGAPSPGIVNAQNGYQSNSVPGVTCSGPPTSSFAVVGGIVTHC